MSHCEDCKDSILNGQKSVIGQPECHDGCGSETDCEGIQTYTDCVGVNPALPCINTESGAELSDVLVALDTKLCQTQNSNCNVKISADDACCGFLNDKLTSSSLDIEVLTANPSNCQTININTKCDVWNNVLPSSTSGTGRFRNKWSNASGFIAYQDAQYSDVKDCIVKLRGTIINAFNPESCSSIIMVLPIAPLKTKTFSVNLFKSVGSCLSIIPAILLISNLGEVSLKTQSGLSGSYSLGLDGLYFEIL